MRKFDIHSKLCKKKLLQIDSVIFLFKLILNDDACAFTKTISIVFRFSWPLGIFVGSNR